MIGGTSKAADLVRDDERGRTHEGSCADILIVDGNFTEDIALADDNANHRTVLKNG